MSKNKFYGPTEDAGRRFGYLTAIRQIGTFKGRNGKSKQHRAVWLFLCDCGNSTEGVLTFIKKQHNASCGCKRLATVEGATKTFMNEYKASAISRGYDFGLNLDEFSSLVNNKCHYCSSIPRERNFSYKNLKPKFNGIDRIDNTKGYFIDNCVSCCSVCNRLKGTLSYDEFLKHLFKINKILKLREKYPAEKNGKIGDLLLELEIVLDKLCDNGLQLGDIHSLVHQHIWTHRKDAVEVYVDDNSSPILKYGHKDQI